MQLHSCTPSSCLAYHSGLQSAVGANCVICITWCVCRCQFGPNQNAKCRMPVADQNRVAGAQVKMTLLSSGMFQDGVPCHIASGLGAGFFAVICGSPVDVVKSRMMGTCSFPHPRAFSICLPPLFISYHLALVLLQWDGHQGLAHTTHG